MGPFCRREFVVMVKGFGEADVIASDEAEARRIWPEFTRSFGFPAGGHPLCQVASSDAKTSTSPTFAWIVSPSEKQNRFHLNAYCSNTRVILHA
jgi:hypothetical protein